jgi:hypothetical protein
MDLVRLLYMERLPYIDEHSISIAAPPERAWEMLIAMMRGLGSSLPVGAIRLLGLQPAQLCGDWRLTPVAGDAIPGFEVAESDAPRCLVLRGHHRFSKYELIFELSADDSASCTLTAQTWAAFPGLAGSIYRGLVIGSRGHRLAVKRMLGDVARRA